MLVASGIGVLLGNETRIVVGFLAEGFETYYLISKEGELLVRAALYVVGAGTRAAPGVDVVFFLEVMAA